MRAVAEVLVKGDVIANGMTILAYWGREVSFGTPTFPAQVWLIVPPFIPQPEANI